MRPARSRHSVQRPRTGRGDPDRLRFLGVLATVAAGPASADVFGPIGLASVGVMPGGASKQSNRQRTSQDTLRLGQRRVPCVRWSLWRNAMGCSPRPAPRRSRTVVAEGDAVCPRSATRTYVSFTTTHGWTPSTNERTPAGRIRAEHEQPGDRSVHVRMGSSTVNRAPSRSPRRSTDRPYGLEYHYELDEARILCQGSAIRRSPRRVAGGGTLGADAARSTRSCLCHHRRSPTSPTRIAPARAPYAPETPATQWRARPGHESNDLVSARYDPATDTPANGARDPNPSPWKRTAPGAVFRAVTQTPAFPSGPTPVRH